MGFDVTATLVVCVPDDEVPMDEATNNRCEACPAARPLVKKLLFVPLMPPGAARVTEYAAPEAWPPWLPMLVLPPL